MNQSDNSSLYLRATGTGCLLELFIVPRAKLSKFVGFHGGYPKVALAAPPIDGRANEELILFMSRFLGVPRKRIELVGGATSRRKKVHIEGCTLEAIQTQLSKG